MRLHVLIAVMVIASVGCSHVQPPKRQIYIISEEALGVGGSGARDCDAEHIQCWNRCWHTPPPYPHTQGDGWHYEYCTRTCREEYMECVKTQQDAEKDTVEEKPPLKFSRVDQALDWLRNHKTEVAIGTIVIIAGVAFVVATGGSGALILAPLAL